MRMCEENIFVYLLFKYLRKAKSEMQLKRWMKRVKQIRGDK
jgi:hypothetical protein